MQFFRSFSEKMRDSSFSCKSSSFERPESDLEEEDDRAGMPDLLVGLLSSFAGSEALLAQRHGDAKGNNNKMQKEKRQTKTILRFLLENI